MEWKLTLVGESPNCWKYHLSGPGVPTFHGKAQTVYLEKAAFPDPPKELFLLVTLAAEPEAEPPAAEEPEAE